MIAAGAARPVPMSSGRVDVTGASKEDEKESHGEG